MSLSVIQRVLLGFGILLLLLLVMAASGFMGIHKVENRLQIATGSVADISMNSNALKDDLSLANAVVLQYLLSKTPDSLEDLSLRFAAHRQEFSEISAVLSEQLKDMPVMNDTVNSISKEAIRFFDYTDVAFSNHKTMLQLQAMLPNEKLDLKDVIHFASEDLDMLVADGDTPEVQFAASYMHSQIESLKVSVNDYFDVRGLDKMQALRTEMGSVISSLKDKQTYLNDDNINDLVSEIDNSITSLNGVIAQHYQNAQLMQESEVLARALSDSMESINASVSLLLSETHLMRARAKVEANQVASVSTLVIVSVLVVSMVIAAGVTLWVSRSIRVPLKEIIAILGQIAEGDFTQCSQVNTKDEFGELSMWVNALVTKLRGVMTNIEQASNDVADSALSHVCLAGESRQLMNSQNQRTTQVASSMSDMVAAVDQVAKSSEIILHQIQSVDEKTSQNRAKMDANIQKIENTLGQIERSTTVVNQLDDYSKSIDRILDVIQAIADQTNLLALNAAIEAARAGEQGRGFAVVADEVRTLATRTHSSTEEIQHVIAQIQQGVTKTVDSMEASRQSASSSVIDARSVGASFVDLQNSMADIRDLSTQIATAAEEQSAVAQDIRKSVLDIAHMSEQATLGSDKSEKDSKGLSALASYQKQLLSQFKIV
ncbi:methyl-accepting chemotaxis protein [Marinomonas sp. IMCC 4694]|uniref:methyl-accepting chemotaxis protein n=1 Tax=Marinomonas sp. IMCC 4694 TaxID=2605432 RepID=UPI0011E8449B|nr:methyl-accepting chemotaxis protein [Marinomonas sp. IMCC 4694]TYL48863.1 methyl-accepting chemotaxis protein [Marinomonas sp. IMCC 4694]